MAVAAGSFILLGGSLAVGPAMLCAAMLVALAVAPADGPGSAMSWLPVGLVLLVAWYLTVGVLGGSLGLRPWGTTAGAALTWSTPAIVALIRVLRRRRSPVVLGADWAASLVAGLVLAGGWLLVSLRAPGQWTRLTSLGTDFARHTWEAGAIARAGALELDGLGYPRAVHTTVGVLSQAMGLTRNATGLWEALSSVTWILLVLIVLGCGTAARLATERVGRVPAVWAGALAGLVSVQTAWFGVMISFGAVMNIAAAVCLLSVLLPLLAARDPKHPSALAGVAAGTAVVAHSWQLVIPVAGAAALVQFVAWLRGTRPRKDGWGTWLSGCAIWISGAALGAAGLATVISDGRSGLISGPTVSGLFGPDWWWAVAVVAAVVACYRLWGEGRRVAGAAAVAMIIAGAATAGYLLWSSDSTWQMPRYYPIKALWTMMIILVPLGVAGGVQVVMLVWRAGGRYARLAVLFGGVVLAAGVAGRTAAMPAHLLSIARAEGGVNWTLAVAEGLESVEVAPEQRDGAFIFGLIPTATIGQVVPGGVGLADYIGSEAMRFSGYGERADSWAKYAAYGRDLPFMCQWMAEHPKAVRFTGSNPASGARLLIDAGCPESVVRPAQWVVIPIERQWLAGTPYADPPYTYPSWAQLVDKLGDLALPVTRPSEISK